MSSAPVQIIAHLASPLCGDAPQLDGLLEYHQVQKQIGTHATEIDGVKIYGAMARDLPPPPMGFIPIPIERGCLDPITLAECKKDWSFCPKCKKSGFMPIKIARCSAPILIGEESETVEYMNRHMDSGNYYLLADEERKTVNHSAGPQKAYHVPLRIRTVRAVSWFAMAFGENCGINKKTGKKKRRSLEASLNRLLGKIRAIGKLHQRGYGLVGRWEILRVEKDYSWYADSPFGKVLMRHLPKGMNHPAPLLGARAAYAACCPPYWHPQRRMEAVAPC